MDEKTIERLKRLNEAMAKMDRGEKVPGFRRLITPVIGYSREKRPKDLNTDGTDIDDSDS